MWLPVQGEGSTFIATVETFNELDQPWIMASVEYRIDCLTNKKTVRVWTNVTPAEVMDIYITPEDNKILNDKRLTEIRQMTIRVNDGAGTRFVNPQPVKWYLQNVLPGREIIT